MGDILVKVMLAFAVVAAIGYPLVRVRPAGEAEDEALDLNEESEILYRRKEAAYAALKELEFDYRTGALSENDYRELEAKYKREAIDAIGAAERWDADGRAADRAAERPRSRSLEKTAGEATKNPRAQGREKVAGRVAGTAAEKAADATAEEALDEAVEPELDCPRCGVAYEPRMRFCASCGERLPTDGNPRAGDARAACRPAECAECGGELDPSDRYCAACGTAVGYAGVAR